MLSDQLQLVSDLRNFPLAAGSSGHERLPLCQSCRAVELAGLAVDEVAFEGEVIVERGMD